MNALASIYFHNYLRFDEMPPQNSQEEDEEKADKIDKSDGLSNKTESFEMLSKNKRKSDFVDSQRPGK